MEISYLSGVALIGSWSWPLSGLTRLASLYWRWLVETRSGGGWGDQLGGNCTRASLQN